MCFDLRLSLFKENTHPDNPDNYRDGTTNNKSIIRKFYSRIRSFLMSYHKHPDVKLGYDCVLIWRHAKFYVFVDV